jgi:hypothetical protein
MLPRLNREFEFDVSLVGRYRLFFAHLQVPLAPEKVQATARAQKIPPQEMHFIPRLRFVRKREFHGAFPFGGVAVALGLFKNFAGCDDGLRLVFARDNVGVTC